MYELITIVKPCKPSRIIPSHTPTNQKKSDFSSTILKSCVHIKRKDQIVTKVNPTVLHPRDGLP